MNTLRSSVRDRALPRLTPLACLLGLCLAGGCGDETGTSDYEAGKAAYEARDLKKAEKMLGRSVEANPDNVDAQLRLARVKIDVAELSAAEEAVSKAVQLAPDDVDVKLTAAEVAWHRKDYKKARELFLQVANDATLDASVRAQGWAGAGVVEMAGDEMAGDEPHLARVDFLRALLLDWKNASARYHLGLLYRDGIDRGGLSYPEAALEQFEIFVRLDSSASPRVQKVQNSIIKGLKDSIARAASDRPGASVRDSAKCSAEIRTADAALAKGKVAEALQHYRAAAQADPLSYPAAFGLAQCWQKTPPSKKGEANPLARAFECYKTACSQSPSKVKTFLQAGELAMKLGYPAQAVEIYSRAVAADPMKLDSIDGLIRALNKTGRSSVARAYQQYRDAVVAKRK